MSAAPITSLSARKARFRAGLFLPRSAWLAHFFSQPLAGRPKPADILLLLFAQGPMASRPRVGRASLFLL